jgi:hypothetical protein
MIRGMGTWKLHHKKTYWFWWLGLDCHTVEGANVMWLGLVGDPEIVLLML